VPVPTGPRVVFRFYAVEGGPCVCVLLTDGTVRRDADELALPEVPWGAQGLVGLDPDEM
jgi:hypothetical protein